MNHRWTQAVTVTVLVVVGSIHSQEQKPPPSLLVFSSKGKVNVGERIVPAAQRDMRNFEAKLQAKEVVSTGADGQVQLGVFGEAKVLLAPNTVVRVPEPAARAEDVAVMEIEKGRAFLRVEKRPEREFRLRTPTMTIAVRGTEFFVNVSPKGEVVGTHQGAVEVGLEFGGNRRLVNVPAGKAVVANGEDAPQLRNLTAGEQNLARIYAMLDIPVLPRPRIAGDLRSWVFGNRRGWDASFAVPRAASENMVQLSMEPQTIINEGRVAAMRADGKLFVFQENELETPENLEPISEVQLYPKGVAVLTERGIIHSWGAFQGTLEGITAIQATREAVLGIARDGSVRGVTVKGAESFPQIDPADGFGFVEGENGEFLLFRGKKLELGRIDRGVVRSDEFRVGQDWVEVHHGTFDACWIDRNGMIFSQDLGKLGERARKVVLAENTILWMDADLEWHSPKMDRFEEERSTFRKLVSGAVDLAFGDSRFYAIIPRDREKAKELVEEEWKLKLRRRENVGD